MQKILTEILMDNMMKLNYKISILSFETLHPIFFMVNYFSTSDHFFSTDLSTDMVEKNPIEKYGVE